MFNPAASLINAMLGIIAFLLSLRFVFNFFNIGRESTFVNWLDSFTQPLIKPFIGILPSFNWGSFLIETPTIIALIVIGLIGYFIASLLSSLDSS